MGRKKRTEAVDKTTVYFLESDLNKIDAKNRFRALRIAKEISLRAVTYYSSNYQKYKADRLDFIESQLDYFYSLSANELTSSMINYYLEEKQDLINNTENTFLNYVDNYLKN